METAALARKVAESMAIALVFNREEVVGRADGYLTKAPKQREPHPTWPSR